MYKEGWMDNDINEITFGSMAKISFRCIQHKSCDGHVWQRSAYMVKYCNVSCPFCNPKTAGHHYVCKCNPNLLSRTYPDVFSRIDRELTKEKEGLTDAQLDLMTKGCKKIMVPMPSSYL